MLLFSILCECTLVKCHCQGYIYGDSKLDNWPASQKITLPACKSKVSVPNSASVPNLDDKVGIKQSEKPRNLFKLNSIEAKLKQTTTVANYWPASHTTQEQTWHRLVSQLCYHQWAKSSQSNIYTILHQNLKCLWSKK